MDRAIFIVQKIKFKWRHCAERSMLNLNALSVNKSFHTKKKLLSVLGMKKVLSYVYINLGKSTYFSK